MIPVRPDQIARILELTDSLGISREAVTIPLGAEGEGSVEVLSDGRFRIVCPERLQFDEWLVALRERLDTMARSRHGR
jgi:hypothetical protein